MLSGGGEGARHKAFLDTLLECRDEEGQGLTDDDIREEVDTFMFEVRLSSSDYSISCPLCLINDPSSLKGHDTVSAATAHTVYLLGANPEAQRRCQQELDEILSECLLVVARRCRDARLHYSVLSVDGARDIEFEDLNKMNYLEWCIKESLRLYPSVPWFARKLNEETDFGRWPFSRLCWHLISGDSCIVSPCSWLYITGRNHNDSFHSCAAFRPGNLPRAREVCTREVLTGASG